MVGWERLYGCLGSSEDNVGCCQGKVGEGGAGCYIVWLTGGGVMLIEDDEVG